MIRVLLAASAALFLLLHVQPAAANGAPYPHQPRHAPSWSGPACDDPAVLRTISSRFHQAERAYWHTGVRMAEIVSPRETAFRDRHPRLIATRYCTAVAYLTDGARHDLVYWLRSDLGFAGMGWGVEFCLVGRDRQMSYAPHCRMLRPL